MHPRRWSWSLPVPSHRVLGSLVRGWPGLPRLAYAVRGACRSLVRPVSLGVRALVSDDGDQVLLVRHSYLDGWYLPGGAVDRGETVYQAAARELAEEAGLTALASAPLLGLYAHLRWGESNHIAVVPVTAWSGTLAVDGVEIVEARFFRVADLPAGATPATRRRIAEYRREVAVGAYW